MHTLCKRYCDLTFTHRVFLRDGGPSHIHGHVWTFEFEFSAERLDANGFVLDFNGLIQLEVALYALKDRLVVSADDPAIVQLEGLPELFNLVVVPDASSEGLAQHYHTLANQSIGRERALRCIRCTVHENASNSATFAA